MNDTIVLKFGGSSVANNERLKIVAEKIINLHNKKNKIVVILSAQGKTTDKLIEEARRIIEQCSKKRNGCINKLPENKCQQQN
ncbi:MAG: hypothetical protein ACLTKT_00630 [Clostridia bacterium]|nr:hypothetical protein [Clostridium sp.]MBS6252162.1 hypothetical protein [Clostridium sp.]